MENSENNLYELVKNFDVAMLTTHQSKDMHARPMLIARLDQGMEVYLITDSDSVKVHEIGKNSHALLTFQSSRQFATVTGEITVEFDRELLETMWKETWKVWFPEGKSDPKIAILKLTAHQGEYWNNAGMEGVKFFFNAAKAYISGERLNPDSAQHSKVNL
jgi:general stress protein 26